MRVIDEDKYCDALYSLEDNEGFALIERGYNHSYTSAIEFNNADTMDYHPEQIELRFLGEYIVIKLEFENWGMMTKRTGDNLVLIYMEDLDGQAEAAPDL